MMPAAGSSGRGPRGQALVEFALVLPVMVVILLGLFDLGRAVYAYNTIANAARVGARVAAVDQTLTSTDCNPNRPVEDPANPHWSIAACAAQSATSLDVSSSDVSVSYSAPPDSTLTCTSSTHEVGCVVSVTVAYAYTPITPLISNLVGTMRMDSTSQVLIERTFP